MLPVFPSQASKCDLRREISFLRTCNTANLISYISPILTLETLFQHVRLHGCAIACALKQTFALCNIFSEGTLLLETPFSENYFRKVVVEARARVARIDKSDLRDEIRARCEVARHIRCSEAADRLEGDSNGTAGVARKSRRCRIVLMWQHAS